MKYCALALTALLITTAPASAQYLSGPTKIITLKDNKTDEVVGTVYVNGSNAVLRNIKGEHIQTMSLNKDGSRTIYDPDGKVLKVVPGCFKSRFLWCALPTGSATTLIFWSHSADALPADVDIWLVVGYIVCVGWYWWAESWFGMVKGTLAYIFMYMIGSWFL
jgi:hypothetical protein